jgi:hypothetical protein
LLTLPERRLPRLPRHVPPGTTALTLSQSLELGTSNWQTLPTGIWARGTSAYSSS